MSEEEKHVEGEKGFVLPETPESEELLVKPGEKLIEKALVLPQQEETLSEQEETEVQLPEEEPPEKEA